ncbi:hypothetical protein GWI33_005382 [Rhynchophorus ferrugineus]|uniref:Uncharacterized protein n=1 Tax=Rhynchophorus ferrugineus TaxID=354439 RepID=A0A834MDV4_RHYFE|nr:hypothetical protein GWI33_005382 [Rhynchophorus ferrugineus]
MPSKGVPRDWRGRSGPEDEEEEEEGAYRKPPINVNNGTDSGVQLNDSWPRRHLPRQHPHPPNPLSFSVGELIFNFLSRLATPQTSPQQKSY